MERVKQKIGDIIRDGPESLMIAADYDSTLTYARQPNEERADTAFLSLLATEYVTDKCREELNKMYQIYHPI